MEGGDGGGPDRGREREGGVREKQGDRQGIGKRPKLFLGGEETMEGKRKGRSTGERKRRRGYQAKEGAKRAKQRTWWGGGKSGMERKGKREIC